MMHSAMMFLFSFALCACVILASKVENNDPGRVAIWSVGGQSSSSLHDTKSYVFSQVKDKFLKETSSSDSIVFLTPKSSSANLFSLSSVSSSFDSATSGVAFPFIYRTDESILMSSFASKVDMENRKTIVEFAQDVKNAWNLEQGSVAKKIFVELSTEDSQNAVLIEEISNAAKKAGKKISFVVVREPAMNAMLPEMHETLSRKLASTSSSSIGNTTEISIFSIYNGPYLYITPDIFTGIMTGLFVAFVLYMGLSCLGEIQGASSFVLKPIPIGKEY